MYGELGYRPWELHRMLWNDLQLAIKGRNDKNEYQESIIRRLAWGVVNSGSNHKLQKNFDKYWPGPGTEKKRRIPEAALAQLRRMKVQEAESKLK